MADVATLEGHLRARAAALRARNRRLSTQVDDLTAELLLARRERDEAPGGVRADGYQLQSGGRVTIRSPIPGIDEVAIRAPEPLRFDEQDPALGLRPFSMKVLDLVATADLLRVRVEVIDTKTGAPTQIIFREPLEPPDCRIPRRFQIRRALLRMLAHELDECLVDERGESVFEAHTPDGASVPPVLPFELAFGRERGRQW